MTVPWTFGLLFQRNTDGPESDCRATADVYLCSYTHATYKGHEDKITVSRQCVTLAEFGREIDRMQKELEQLRHVARRKFSELEESNRSQTESI